jgi:NAD(P)-dependent dehydrogenase (short-subunit alcohol dehydrogenase family)
MMPKLFDLAGKVALITGGNSGIGLRAAHALADAGAEVVVWGRRAELNRAAGAELAVHGRAVRVDQVDVADTDAIALAFEAAVGAMGRVDTVFVNAGTMSRAASFLDITAEQYAATLQVNLHGAFATVQCAVRHMVARASVNDAGGSIIANGSLIVTCGVTGLEHYAVAKGGLASLSKSVAAEYGRFGVRMNLICPGSIETSPAVAARRDIAEQRYPIPRNGTADDLAGIIVYLASDASSYHTGDVITIDGGATATAVGVDGRPAAAAGHG